MKVYVFETDARGRPVREEEAEIKVCKKTVWAILPSGKRKLVGASAFFTLPSAQRSHRSLLARTVAQMEKYFSANYLRLTKTYAYGAMQKRLQTYH